jgi:hypothetical protein
VLDDRKTDPTGNLALSPVRRSDAVTKLSGREVVERYMRAMPGDFHTLAALRHPDFVGEYPQSGEVIRGHEAWQAAHERYADVHGETRRVTGSEDRWILSPGFAGFTPMRVVGSGDTFTVESIGTYPGGESYHVISIIELRDGLVFRGRTYFAAPFEAPEWRARWVEQKAAGNQVTTPTGASSGVTEP